MESSILRDLNNTGFEGCDAVVCLPEERRGDRVRILQLTDMQAIDATQQRRPDRLRADEIEAWHPTSMDAQCGNHIRSLVAQARPDLILMTGDLVYGSFDDTGDTLRWLCALMDSFRIPWAPVFGNHDNESAIGVSRQCEELEKSRYCLFRRGTVSGNGNYTVGIACEGELIRVIHMLDSNGCRDGIDPSIIKKSGIYPDQLDLIRSNTARITVAQGRAIPAFVAFHIPVASFIEAEMAKGYKKSPTDRYVIGVDVPAQDGDFGFSLEEYKGIAVDGDFVDFLRAQHIEGVFAGHVHNNCFRILHRGIMWTFGLKTGQYDYHIPYQIGGTLTTLDGAAFEVQHLPSLVPCAPMPARAPMFRGLFAAGEEPHFDA